MDTPEDWCRSCLNRFAAFASRPESGLVLAPPHTPTARIELKPESGLVVFTLKWKSRYILNESQQTVSCKSMWNAPVADLLKDQAAVLEQAIRRLAGDANERSTKAAKEHEEKAHRGIFEKLQNVATGNATAVYEASQHGVLDLMRQMLTLGNPQNIPKGSVWPISKNP